MNKDLLTKKIEPYVLKDGEFLIERTSQKGFLTKRSFLLSEGVRAHYLLIVDSAISDKVSRYWNLSSKSSLFSSRLFLKDEDLSDWLFSHHITDQAKIESRSLILALNEEKFNLKSIYNFDGLNSFGRINVDSLVSGKAVVKISSDVNILPSAQKSDTRVDMTLRLEGAEAKGEMIPSLNISANDVRAGHSAGTFRLKPEDLFYLQSRGLSNENIRRLFILSLGKTFVSGLPQEQTREEILTLITNNL